MKFYKGTRMFSVFLKQRHENSQPISTSTLNELQNLDYLLSAWHLYEYEPTPPLLYSTHFSDALSLLLDWSSAYGN